MVVVPAHEGVEQPLLAVHFHNLPLGSPQSYLTIAPDGLAHLSHDPDGPIDRCLEARVDRILRLEAEELEQIVADVSDPEVAAAQRAYAQAGIFDGSFVEVIGGDPPLHTSVQDVPIVPELGPDAVLQLPPAIERLERRIESLARRVEDEGVDCWDAQASRSQRESLVVIYERNSSDSGEQERLTMFADGLCELRRSYLPPGRLRRRGGPPVELSVWLRRLAPQRLERVRAELAAARDPEQPVVVFDGESEELDGHSVMSRDAAWLILRPMPSDPHAALLEELARARAEFFVGTP